MKGWYRSDFCLVPVSDFCLSGFLSSLASPPRCESAVFYHRAINATRPCELNSWIQLFSSHGLVAFTARGKRPRSHKNQFAVGSFPNDPRARGTCVQPGAGHNSRVAEPSMSVRSLLCGPGGIQLFSSHGLVAFTARCPGPHKKESARTCWVQPPGNCALHPAAHMCPAPGGHSGMNPPN
jgi:hypothetical protein